MICPNLGGGGAPSGPTTVNRGSYQLMPRLRNILCGLVGDERTARGGGDEFYFQPRCRGVCSSNKQAEEEHRHSGERNGYSLGSWASRG